MSEKRFVIGDDNLAMFEVVDIEKEELLCECRAVDVEQLVDLLNSLYDENEELQKARWNDAKEFSALFKQNYGFKRENEQLRECYSKAKKYLHEVIEENEDLKKKNDCLKVYKKLVDELEKITCKKIEDVIGDLKKLSEENKEQADTIKHLEEYSGDLEHDNKTLQKEKQEWQDRALELLKIMRAEFTEKQLKQWSNFGE